MTRQNGTVRKVGSKWYGTYRLPVADPTTGEKGYKQRSVVLGLISQITKEQARELLQTKIFADTSSVFQEAVYRGEVAAAEKLPASSSAGSLAAAINKLAEAVMKNNAQIEALNANLRDWLSPDSSDFADTEQNAREVIAQSKTWQLRTEIPA